MAVIQKMNDLGGETCRHIPSRIGVPRTRPTGAWVALITQHREAHEVIVTYHPQAEIESSSVRAEALISITGTANADAAIPADLFGHVLRMQFDDVPFSGPWSSYPGGEIFNGITVEQFHHTMAFARKFMGHIAVHCLQGQSRSTAIALAVLADRLKNGPEAVTILLDGASRRIMPNPGIVRMAEAELGITGLDASLITESPDYRWWKSNWIAEGWR